MGREIYRRKIVFKTLHGFAFEDLRVPSRVIEAPAPGGKIDQTYIKNVIDEMQKLIAKEDSSPVVLPARTQ